MFWDCVGYVLGLRRVCFEIETGMFWGLVCHGLMSNIFLFFLSSPGGSQPLLNSLPSMPLLVVQNIKPDNKSMSSTEVLGSEGSEGVKLDADTKFTIESGSFWD